MTTTMWPLRRAGAVAGADVAVCCSGQELTYREVIERCDRLAAGLVGLGLERGDRVAVVGANCHRYLELYQAVPGAGHGARAAQPAAHRRRARLRPHRLRRPVWCSRTARSPGCRRASSGSSTSTTGYEQLLAGAPAEASVVEPDDADLAGLFYTGGTTGAAKGVMLTHRNLVANALHFQAYGGFDRDTVWLIVAPLFHAAGSIAVLATVWHGGRQIVLPAFDAGQALDLIEAHRVTATLVVPTMLAALNDEQLARPRDVSSLRSISHGGSPTATETLRRAHQAFPAAELVHIYGATETSPIATVMRHEEEVLDGPRASSCGPAAIGVEIAVLGADGVAVPAGAVGEIAIRGANVMRGYWNKPEETAAALVDGWYRSGDIGYVDEESYVYLVDRAKDMIVTGGENVYSTEVEDVLYRHPAVLEAAVFAVPDDRWGEAVHAVVVPRDDVGAVDEDELVRHCRASIAGYKVPKRIDVRHEPLPKSGAGKVLKRELRAPFWAGRETMIGGT